MIACQRAAEKKHGLAKMLTGEKVPKESGAGRPNTRDNWHVLHRPRGRTFGIAVQFVWRRGPKLGRDPDTGRHAGTESGCIYIYIYSLFTQKTSWVELTYFLSLLLDRKWMHMLIVKITHIYSHLLTYWPIMMVIEWLKLWIPKRINFRTSQVWKSALTLYCPKGLFSLPLDSAIPMGKQYI